MKKVGEIWGKKEGNKKIWYVQFPKGVMGFERKKDAILWQEQLLKRNYN